MNIKQLLLAASAVLLAADLHAQAIFGSVQTTAGVPIDGVLVRGTQTVFPFQRYATSTDSSGGYVLGSGLSGPYEVEAVEAGYTFTPASTNVTIRGSSIRVDFTTPATAPMVTTLAAVVIRPDFAVLMFQVRPNGAPTMVWFEYGFTAGYGNIASYGSAGSDIAFSSGVNVSDLLNNTTYHFRAIASNSFGVRFGADLSFTTLSGIPSVVTLAPTGGDATTMSLHGSVNPNGAGATAWFEVGTTTNYGFPAVPQFMGNGTNTTNFTQALIGLTPGTTYHYRAAARTSFGTNYGADRLFTPVFSYSGFGVTPSAYNGTAWGDYDNDGRLDILVAGYATAVWRNTGSGFVNVNAGLPYAADGATAWGDFDHDGRLDILLTGWAFPNFNTAFARVYRNQGGGTFADSGAGLPQIARSAVAWGDYDNDGRLDVLLTGLNTATNPVTQLWRNTGSGFAPDGNVVLPGVAFGAVAWGDFDNDGRLDILLTGSATSNSVQVLADRAISQVWRNTGNGFVNLNAGLPGVSGGNNRSAAAWGDYDGDGRLDLALAGMANGTTGTIAQVWRNTGGGFALNTNAPLTGVTDCSLAWGDYDNDGRLDVLLTGRRADFSALTEVWRNTGGGFVNIGAGLPGTSDGAAAWGDYDNDGRLDLVMNGFGGNGWIWRNNIPAANSPPTTPSGLSLSVSNSLAALAWNAPADDTTPAAGLTYNVRIGTTPGGADVLAPMSAANGFRRLPQIGNAQAGLNAAFRFDLGTTYYWSVQAVDNAFAGSPFAPEQSFKFLPVSVPPASTTIIPGDLNGDGVVDQSELDAVLANYWPNSPWLEMTDPMKLPDGFFQFALTNASAWIFSVEVTTNLLDWEFLGPAYPVYQFLDLQGTNAPQRSYRLRWP